MYPYVASTDTPHVGRTDDMGRRERIVPFLEYVLPLMSIFVVIAGGIVGRIATGRCCRPVHLPPPRVAVEGRLVGDWRRRGERRDWNGMEGNREP